MNKNINYKRVRRIKAAIYLILLCMVIIPAIVMIAIGVTILNKPGAIRNAAELGGAGSAMTGETAGLGESSSSQIFDAHPLESSKDDSFDGGFSQADVSGGENSWTSQPSTAVNSISPHAEGSEQAEGSAEPPPYYDTEIPNTGFPKPGEMAR